MGAGTTGWERQQISWMEASCCVSPAQCHVSHHDGLLTLLELEAQIKILYSMKPHQLSTPRVKDSKTFSLCHSCPPRAGSISIQSKEENGGQLPQQVLLTHLNDIMDG
uniref:uncharacterized protein LOC117707516 n=1 Tax=Arvicanthis niloticus TaxID=61156 RepID=UPI00402B9089